MCLGTHPSLKRRIAMAANIVRTDVVSTCLPLERLRTATHLVLLLDYDGTLVPFAPTPEQAAPDSALLELLFALTERPGTKVHIVSGRDRDTLEQWFSGLPIGLYAEHGLWARPNPMADWQSIIEISTEWKDQVLPIIEEFTRQTPGSSIEHKSASIAWHYRLADLEIGAAQAKELRIHLDAISRHLPVHVLPGDKVFEVKLQGVDKGQIVHRFFSEMHQTMFLAMGDDNTDEDLFAALPEGSVAIHVGPNPSRAPYRLNDYREARVLLQGLLEEVTPHV